jgi:hypothetical protein
VYQGGAPIEARPLASVLEVLRHATERYLLYSSSEMSEFPMSPLTVRVLVPFLRPMVVGAWCFGLGWVTKE